MQHLIRGIFLSAVLPVVFAPQALAQPYTLEEDIQITQIELFDYPGAGGVRWGSAEGTLGDDEQLLFSTGLSSRSASEVFLIALDPERPVSLALAKDNWKQKLRECTTDNEGFCTIDFRTHSDVGFRVNAQAGAAWRLIVITSPPISIDAVIPSPLFAADKKDAARYEQNQSAVAGDTNTNWMMVAVISLLVVIAALLAFIIRKNSRAAAAVVVISIASFSPVDLAYANAGNVRATPESELHELRQRMDAMERREAAAASRSDSRDLRKRDEALGKHWAKVQKQVTLLKSLRDFAGKWDDLSTCSASKNPPSTPRIPSFCQDDAACGACYADARGEFNRVRGVFEDLRTIYQCTKTFTDSAIALGDNASGIHAVTGLTWQLERAKIVKSVVSLQQAYDKKFVELSGKLHSSMIDISICEAQYGELDWYDRFGFVYYEFMQDKYKRSD